MNGLHKQWTYSGDFGFCLVSHISKAKNSYGRHLGKWPCATLTQAQPLVVWRSYIKEPNSGHSTLTFHWSSHSLWCPTLCWWGVCWINLRSLRSRSLFLTRTINTLVRLFCRFQMNFFPFLFLFQSQFLLEYCSSPCTNISLSSCTVKNNYQIDYWLITAVNS